MNGRERIAAALRGERPDRVPVMLHNFMPAAREAGLTLREYRESPEAIAGAFVRAVETYGYDGVLVDVDTATLAGALGVPVELPEDEPALCRGSRLGDPGRGGRPAAARRRPRPAGAGVARGRPAAGRGGSAARSTSAATATRPRSRSRAWCGAPADWMMELMDEDNRPRVERLLDHCGGGRAAVPAADGRDGGAHALERGQPRRARPRLAGPLRRVRAAVGEAARRRGAPPRAAVRAAHLRAHRPDPRRDARHGCRRPGARPQDRRAARPRAAEGPGRLHRQPRPERRRRARHAGARRGSGCASWSRCSRTRRASC